MKYGIWYDDGRIDFGWLGEEGRHGRDHRFETDDLQEAERSASTHALMEQATIFSVEPLNGDSLERFKRVRRLAYENRLQKAEALVRDLRRLLDQE